MEESILPKAWESLLSSYSFIPVIVKTIDMFRDTNWEMEPSVHDHFEMVYIKKGNAVFKISGEPASIGPNDIIVIRPGQPHKLSVQSKTGCEYIVLSFLFRTSNEAEISKVSLADFLDFVSSRERGGFFTLKVSQKNDIITLMDRILKERQGREPASEFLSRLLVMELFVLLSRALKMEWENSIRNERNPRIKELMESSAKYIRSNFERDISIDDVSNYIFLSRSYFARAFKEHMGVSPKGYLLKVRIERAKELLQESDKKVGDIALDVGFSTPQRFNEIFRKLTGMSPMKYRKNSK